MDMRRKILDHLKIIRFPFSSKQLEMVKLKPARPDSSYYKILFDFKIHAVLCLKSVKICWFYR